MSPVTAAPPLQLLVGDSGHGVTAYGADVAAALARLDSRTTVAVAADLDDACDRARSAPRTHVHVTDRLFGASPEEAAGNLERLASVTRLTITVHDLPQDSDGLMLPRRVAAYARFFAAAEATVVNSRHEHRLVSEFLPPRTGSGVPPHVIPLGARSLRPRASLPESAAEATPMRDLVALLAGYVYPGKGHEQAIAAAAEAAAELRGAAEPVGRTVVRAIGGPSAGHDRDVRQLRTDAAHSGIQFEMTGFLDDDAFARRMHDDGIPVAAHQHISASRSMLDWVEAGRRPLVMRSRYAEEMAMLRPETMTLYDPSELARALVAAWRNPAGTWLGPDVRLAPTLRDVADDYRTWWARMGAP